MRIVLFVSSMNAGGAERVAATLANAWVKRGVEVYVVATHLASSSSFYPLDESVHMLWLGKQVKAKWWWPAALAKLVAIRKVVRTVQPDVVLSFLTNVNVNVLCALKGVRVPVVVCERTNPEHSKSAGRLLRRLRRLCYPWATAAVAQTKDGVQALQRLVPSLKQALAIANPLPDALQVSDVAKVTPLDAVSVPADMCLEYPQHSVEAAEFSVVAMGRLVEAKGFDDLIRAFAHIAAAHPRWQLCIYGDGPLRQMLRSQADATGFGARIRLLGRTEQPWQALGSAQLFVLSSHYEGFPNVLLEAMALGKACVSVDCPSGPKELSDNGRYAHLVPAGAEHVLAEAMSQLMADPERRVQLGEAAQKWVAQQYSTTAVLQQWEALFTNLQGNK